jgi:uncharacterized protein with ParB-like and HNH nuclease domain
MQPKIGHTRDLLLGEDTCLVIPPYQRPYEWNSDRWQSLIKDIVESLTGQKSNHFIGVAITTESKPICEKAKSAIVHKHIDIIDGQQRLLTLRVWLQAIIDHNKDLGSQIDINFTNVYCQETDLEDWEAVLSGKWISKYRNYKVEESGLLNAYTYFRWVLWLGEDALLEREPELLPKPSRRSESISSLSELHGFWQESLDKRKFISESQDTSLQIARSQLVDPETLLRATVDKLTLLVLEISDQDEDPADIFNALNGQRSELFQFDHLRNYIFANIKEVELRAELYENKWKDVERMVSQQEISVKGSSALDTYLYDLLISLGEKKFQSISKDKTARQITRYFNSNRNKFSSKAKPFSEEVILPNLVSWTSLKMNGKPLLIKHQKYELPTTVQDSLKLMEWMSSGPVAPLLLNVVNRYYLKKISDSELIHSVKAIENYLARFIISGDALSPLRASIMNICAKLGGNYNLEDLQSMLRDLMHTDESLKKRLLPSSAKAQDPYGDYAKLYESRTPRQLLALFQSIEKYRAGEHCSNLLRETSEDPLTIEHIYPQSPDRWKGDLKDWDTSNTALKNRLHTLGNLAIVPKSINSEMSNEKFLDKKKILKQNVFVELTVNREWQSDSYTKWTPELVDSRSVVLLDDFLKAYPYE